MLAIFETETYRFRVGQQAISLVPLWLRERALFDGAVDQDNGQRRYDPCDLDPNLRFDKIELHDQVLDVSFSDGVVARFPAQQLCEWLGWTDRDDEPPPATVWPQTTAPLTPYGWDDLVDQTGEAMLAALTSFFTYGYIIVSDVPTVPGTLETVADHFGFLVPSAFGRLFDVQSKPNPTDLAYTGLSLAAHSDQPYRKPVPGVQLLHSLVNAAEGGDSTLVDAFASVNELASYDPEAFHSLCELEVEFRYDTVASIMIDRSPIIERASNGGLKRIRFSTRLDYVEAAAPDSLRAFYRGRRWLRDQFADPANQLRFRLHPGDVLLMDNYRLLHGRTEFDPTSGPRHLQGCYIDHERLNTLYRLAYRRAEYGIDPTGVAL